MGWNHGYENKSTAALALARALLDAGWNVTDYHPGVSDGMTDYFQSGRWWGFATHPSAPRIRIVAAYSRAPAGEAPPCKGAGNQAFAWIEQHTGSHWVLGKTFGRARTIAHEGSPYGGGSLNRNAEGSEAARLLASYVAECQRYRTDIAPAPRVVAEVGTALPGEIVFAENEEKGGIELRFGSKPIEEVRDALKANGFRWSRGQALWWAKRTPQRLEFVRGLCGQAVAP